jgi:hypothetical protein
MQDSDLSNCLNHIPTNLNQLLNRAFQSYQYTHQLKFLKEILEIRSFSLLMGSENQFSVKLFTIFKHEKKNVSKFFTHHGSPLAGSTQKSTQKAQKMDSSQGQQKGGA